MMLKRAGKTYRHSGMWWSREQVRPTGTQGHGAQESR